MEAHSEQTAGSLGHWVRLLEAARDRRDRDRDPQLPVPGQPDHHHCSQPCGHDSRTSIRPLGWAAPSSSVPSGIEASNRSKSGADHQRRADSRPGTWVEEVEAIRRDPDIAMNYRTERLAAFGHNGPNFFDGMN